LALCQSGLRHEHADADSDGYGHGMSDAYDMILTDINMPGATDLKETSGALGDSTSTPANGAASGGPTYNVAGKIGPAVDFDGVDDRFAMTNPAKLQITGAITVSAWVRLDQTQLLQETNADVLWKWAGGVGGYTLMLNDGGLSPARNFQWSICDGSGDTGADHTIAATTLAVGNRYYLTGVWSPAGGGPVQKTIYVNGSVSTTADSTKAVIGPSAGTNFMIGGNGGASNFNGTIDEARVSNVARSADWILTEYNNQNSPSTFYNVSPRVGSPC
jgi:hypothetical protein